MVNNNLNFKDLHLMMLSLDVIPAQKIVNPVKSMF